MNRRQLTVCLLVAVPLAVAIAFLVRPTIEAEKDSSRREAAFDPTALKATLDARRMLDRTLWAPEQSAVEHENTFVRLWDALRADANMTSVLGNFAFETITFGEPVKTKIQQNEIVNYVVSRNPRKILANEFRRMVAQWRDNGYELKQSEWHHESFQWAENGRHTSTFAISLHIASESTNQRIEVMGPMIVTWSGRAAGGFPIPSNIDASGLVAKTRKGAPAFLTQFTQQLEAIQSEATHNDVLATDLDHDGSVELVYPRTNLLMRNDGAGNFRQERLCDSTLRGICEGLLVDFNGDGRTDLLCAAINPEGTGRAIFVYEASDDGRFSTEPRQLTPAQVQLLSPDSITVGDIDFDGDLDLYVTQYHAPYRDGKMPSPYYDANDGLPSYLFINDGLGRLHDATEERGLSGKRNRRTYRSSLVDLDDDGDLDLLVTSDFSGVDLYENDGRGFFRDVTERWVQERTLFGMSHVVADLNNDAKLDIYATGMASTTARRLNAMGLVRTDFPDNRRWRSQLAHGNRLFFHQPGPAYLEGPGSPDVARAGWSWGCAAFDVENDGDVDLYVANGHLSGESSADYCTRFWCHDIYEGHTESPGFMDLVRRNSTQLGTEVSWNGYEKNRLYLNRDGIGFTSAGFLMDVAMEQDSRGVLAEDINGDGRMDLLIGYADRTARPPRYALRGLLNRWRTKNHWIGVRVGRVPGALSVGAKVVVRTSSGVKIDTLITGESFAAQQAPVAHFGLGSTARVLRIEVHWVGGRTTRLENPAIDQYHLVELPPSI